MIAAIVATAGITAVAVFFFLIESDGLSQIHVRVRTQLLNTTRWAFVVALTWLLIPAAFSQDSADRPVTIIGMVGLAGALILIPVRWLVRIGGREHTWELRSARLEVARLANRIRRDPEFIIGDRIDQAIARIEALRTPSTRELCDLMLAHLHDLAVGSESWNEAGRRSIRLNEISREMWPGDVPLPDYDGDELTFRWRLYKDFGRLMEVGAGPRTKASTNEFEMLLASLEEFERPDTSAFIADVRRSGRHWLKGEHGIAPWIDSYHFEALGPNGFEEVLALWGRDSALWGARLDEEDLRAIAEDLAKRRSAEAVAPRPAARELAPGVPASAGTARSRWFGRPRD